MCGIVGYISQNDNIYVEPKLHFMRYALALDTLRGEDSTGIITLSKRFKVNTLKTTIPGDRFVHHKDYQKGLTAGWAKIGHNRAATRGKVNVDNAHPFTFKTVTMVHNGTLRDGGFSLPTYDAKIGEVDSMQIAHALAEHAPEECGKVLSEIHGSYALVWTDTRDESINMVRNSERPLHFTWNNNKDMMWFMSDGHHLHSINKSFGQHACRGGTIFEMDQLKVLKFRKGSAEPEVIKYNPFVPPVTRVMYRNGQTTKTTKGTKTGGKNRSATNTTAMQRAHQRWAKSIESSGTEKKGSGSVSNVRIRLQGRLRTIPKCMLTSLRSEFCLGPDDLLRFQPEDAVSLENGNYRVSGTVFHKDWMDTPLDMTINEVRKVEYRAYKKDDWLVRPIGVCAANEFDKRHCGMLGMLVHCDWNGYAKAELAKEAVEDKEEEKVMVVGPGGKEVEWPKLKKLLEAGCINCGMDLLNAPVSEMLEVNNGHDLCCKECIQELDANLNNPNNSYH